MAQNVKKQNNFSKAYGKLQTNDAKVVKPILMRLCKWDSHQAFRGKLLGLRDCSEFSPKGINEVSIVESTFRAFGLDAWTGEQLTPS